MTFTEKLQLTKDCYLEMGLIISTCEKSDKGVFDLWEVFWDEFWVISGRIPFKIDWYDPESTYEEDMRSRFSAVKGFVEQLGLEGEIE